MIKRIKYVSRFEKAHSESDIEEMHVSDDGHSASGLLSGGRAPAPHVKKPTIEVKAAGDLYVLAAGQLASER